MVELVRQLALQPEVVQTPNTEEEIFDLIDPEALPLDQDFGCVLQSNVPVVVQFSRVDTRQPPNAIFSTLAYSEP